MMPVVDEITTPMPVVDEITTPNVVVKVKSDTIKNDVAQEPGMLGP